jgi:hypothetical protein
MSQAFSYLAAAAMSYPLSQIAVFEAKPAGKTVLGSPPCQ